MSPSLSTTQPYMRFLIVKNSLILYLSPSTGRPPPASAIPASCFVPRGHEARSGGPAPLGLAGRVLPFSPVRPYDPSLDSARCAAVPPGRFANFLRPGKAAALRPPRRTEGFAKEEGFLASRSQALSPGPKPNERSKAKS